MRWLTLLAALPLSVSAQSWTAGDLDSAVRAGRSSARFGELVNLYADFKLDTSRETQIANIHSQIERLQASLRDLQTRQRQIADTLASKHIELSKEQIDSRQAEAMDQLVGVSRRLSRLGRLTLWIQSGGSIEPGFSVDELEAFPRPMQSMDEIRQLTAEAFVLQNKLANPSTLTDQELAILLNTLTEEQASLQARISPITEAIAMLTTRLATVSAQPTTLSQEMRTLVAGRREAIREVVEQ